MYNLLGLLNLLTPKQWGSRRVASGLAYGPHVRHKLDIYAPRSGKGPWPIVFFVYGGGWDMGERRYFEFVGRALASAGYVVVVPDYRLVPEVRFPAFLDDCSAAFAWTVEHIAQYGGDPQRFAVMGHSAGAYNALMLVFGERYLPSMGFLDRVKAGIGLSGPYNFYPFDVPASIAAFGATRDPRATQPINLTRPGLPPMLLATGDADKLVRPANTVKLAQKLRDAGVDVTETHYPGLSHAATLLALGAWNRHRAPVLADCIAFLKAHL
jgi:acetyl esterase/lipase